MRRLTNPIRPYAWGSRTALAQLRGLPVPSAAPEAELWLGAHPSAPSALPDGSTLLDAFAADPALLGPAAGGRLPYLLKLLAAAEPLSLQAHPDAEQARAGFAAEDRSAAEPTYVDAYPKPELLVALGDFDGLCGFRDPEESAALLTALGVPALQPVVDALRTGTLEQRLRVAVERLLRWPDGERATVVEQVAKAADPQAPLAADLGRRYPDDMGVVVALLLNRVRLRPDEAVYMPAGNLHAYLHGFGVEIMAASDNVLRGGLTPKRVNVDELLRILRYEVLADPVVRPRTMAPGLRTWPVPVADFALHQASAQGAAVALPGGGPRIVVCTAGRGVLRAGAAEAAVAPGESVFVSAAEPPVTVAGPGLVVFQASAPALR